MQQQVDKQDARGAETPGIARYVLGASMALIVVAMAIVLLVTYL